MLEQELRDLMGCDYPREDDDREILLLRVSMFPNSIDIYDDHLNWIIGFWLNNACRNWLMK